MLIFRTSLVFALGATLLNLLLAQFNNEFPSTHLFCGGLFVAYSAFHLHPRAGLCGIFLTGLFMDARLPVPFGTEAVALAVLHVLVFKIRERFNRNENASRIFVAIVANIIFGIVLAAACRFQQPIRLLPTLASLLLSQLLLFLITPWYFAAQNRLVRLLAPARGDTHIQRTRSTWLTK